MDEAISSDALLSSCEENEGFGRTVSQSPSTTRTQRFSVTYEFPVTFTAGVFDPANSELVESLRRVEPEKRHRVLVFVDTGVLESQPEIPAKIRHYAEHHAEHLELAADPVPVPGGEGVKQGLAHVIDMQRAMFEHHIDRHSYAIAIGGGAMLDAVGLAAATAHRGIRHIRIPTTALSQNDSGVGVKNGVNLFESKNFFGTFAPPFAVINDLEFIETLPAREKRSGLAEAVKVALIRDRRFFEWLERSAAPLAQFERDDMAVMIRRCAELHMQQIAHGGDPFESGTARPLDFGHWAAHRLELLTGFALRHGEAVAIGIALDTEYSVLAGMLGRGDGDRVMELLRLLGFDLWHPALEAEEEGGSAVLRGLAHFREHLGGDLTVTLLEGLGRGVEVHEIDEARVLQGIACLKERARPE